MGIDVYLKWKGQTVDEEKAQFTGFSIHSGHTGYLREAYHGGPYATKLLIPEGWESEDGEVTIPASKLRERLPVVLQAAKERSKNIYKEDPADDKALKAFEDFVDLAERKEAETGEPCTIMVSA